MDVGGQDATEAFEDVGHSDEAREILEGMLVGDLKRMVCLPLPAPSSPDLVPGYLLLPSPLHPLFMSTVTLPLSAQEPPSFFLYNLRIS